MQTKVPKMPLTLAHPVVKLLATNLRLESTKSLDHKSNTLSIWLMEIFLIANQSGWNLIQHMEHTNKKTTTMP